MRLKLPAWGRELRAMRDRGDHPPRVWVLAGHDWGARRPTTAPSVGVGDDWAPGRTDWRPLAGLSAHIVDRDGIDLLALGFEIAHSCAPVVVHYLPSDDVQRRIEGAQLQDDLMSLLWCERHKRGSLWSAGLAEDYEARALLWRHAMIETVLEEAA